MNLKIKTDNSKESTKIQVINNNSSPIGICKPRHILRICLGLQPNFSEVKSKIDIINCLDMISWFLGKQSHKIRILFRENSNVESKP